MIGWLVLGLMVVGGLLIIWSWFLAQMPYVDNTPGIVAGMGAGLFGTGIAVLVGAGIYSLM